MKSLLVMFVAMAFFATGEALKCYECAGTKSGCADPFDKSAEGVKEITCSEANPVCAKWTTELSNGTTGGLRTCMRLSQVSDRHVFNRASGVWIARQSQNYCDTDLCNGVSATSAALSMLMIVAVPFVFGNRH